MRSLGRAFAAAASTALAFGISAGVAHAATPTVFQVNGNSTTCTDTGGGAGSPATPFCTIQAAVNAAVAPGDVVVIAGGTYMGAVDIKSVGTADAPIVIESSNNAPVQIVDGPGQTGPAVTFDGASYVNFVNGMVVGAYGAPALSVASLLVTGSSHIHIENLDMADTTADFAVTVAGSSSDVSFVRSILTGPHGGVVVQAGSSGDVISTNEITSRGTGIEVDGASNTAITSNTLRDQTAVADQIAVTSHSTGTVIKDNVLAYPVAPGGGGAAISVDSTSAAGTTDDYNVVWPVWQGRSTPVEPAYSWAGTNYAAQAAFNQATGQGAHDLVADPRLQADTPFSVNPLAPQFNSADYSATGWQTWDVYGHFCQGDPYLGASGAGIDTSCQRGAVQQPFESVPSDSVAAQGPLGVTVTSLVTGDTQEQGTWFTLPPEPTPAITYVINWGDGTSSAPIPASVNTGTATAHTYAKPGTYKITDTTNFPLDGSVGNATSFMTTALGAGILYQEERFADHWSAPSAVTESTGIAQAAITAMPDGSTQYVAVTTSGVLEHNIDSASGLLQGWRALTQPGVNVASASIAGMPNGSSQIVEVTSTGVLMHDIRNADGTWQSNGWASPAGSTGIAQAAITAMPNGDAQLVAVTTGGVLEHNIRQANGIWQGWRPLSQTGVTVANASIAGMPDGSSQLIEVTSAGTLLHNIRNANGTWQPGGWSSPAGSTGITQAAITAMPDGDSQLVAVTTGGVLEHNIRHAGGAWQGWAVPAQTNLVAAVADAGVAGLPNGNSQIIELSAD